VSVHCEQALGVERRPADEEGDHHGHCKQNTRIRTVRGQLVTQEEGCDLGNGRVVSCL
jgi:hypothetical protein